MNEAVNILVVDDNQENLKVVGGFLKDKGYNIALALDGNSALIILENNKIDLVLLDIMMPGMDGFEVCTKIKEQKKLTEIPIIFLTAMADTDNIIKGFQVGGIDYVTKPFNREELLIRVKTHLDLSVSKKKLLETIKTRDKLYSIIAHDIRTPFADIAMLISAIAQGRIDTCSSSFSEIMLDLEKSTYETYMLLNNLLEWTKLQVGTINIKPQNLHILPVIDDCMHLLQGSAKVKNISIESQIPIETVAYFDEVTMHTVFRNIISNAIKFTSENGKITIESQLYDGYVSVIIKDTGIGMPDDVIHRIFDNNESYTSRGTKNEHGSGLGLHLVKEMVEQNKGMVTVESLEGKGTTFKVDIPGEVIKEHFE